MPTLRRSFPRPAVAALAPLAFLLSLASATSGALRGGAPADAPPFAAALAAPRVTFTPASGTSYSGATSTKSQAVSVGVCSDAIVTASSTRTIVFNGVSVVSNFTGGPPEDPDVSCETEVVFSGTVTLVNGTNTLVFSITDAQGTTVSSATYTYTYTGGGGGGGTVAVAVTPDGGAQAVADSLPSAAAFTVKNTGTAAGTFTLSAACSGTGVSGCAPSRASVTLAAGESSAVGVTFRAGAASTAATVMLKAWQTSATTVRDSGSVAVTVANEPDAGTYGEAYTETVTARGLCLTASLGDGAAYECGDLRLAHALPATRILNRASAPALIYNSRQARWVQMVGSLATTPAVTPDSVKAVLTVSGVNRANGAWAGWTGGTTRWISVGFDANTLGTGVFPYTLTLTTKKAGVETALATRTGQFIQVNRSNSPYGRGWWVAGLEQLVLLPANQILWIGGDGSAKVYAPTGTTGRWVAASLTRPDTLKAGASSGWVRDLPGGGRVEFNAAGEHVFTRNSLGHYTEFVHAGGKLQKIVMARGSAFNTGYEYLFEYGTNGKLNRVVAPYAAVAGDRNVGIATDASGHVTAITDPDSSVVSFTPHATIAGPVVRRTDRMGVPTDFTYGGYLRLTTVEVDRDSTPGIATTFSPQDMLGRPGTPAVLPADLKTVIDGPRPASDAVDVASFRQDRYGSPVELVDALGNTTRVVRGDARFPALATYVRGATGAEQSAAYDARGNLASSTDWHRFAGVATSFFEWDPKWDAVTRSTSPTGLVSTAAFDSVTGLPLWEQAGSDAARRIRYSYRPLTDASAPGLVDSVRSDAATARGEPAQRVEYDARGNLSAAVSPLGFRTEAASDRIGRDTLAKPPVGARTRTTYRINGDVLRTVTTAGAMDSLTVAHTYDREGRVLTTSRSVRPDSAAIGTMTITLGYDRLGRMVSERDPLGKVDSTFYNAAGQDTLHRTRRRGGFVGATGIRVRYDAVGRVTQRITPGYHYDKRSVIGYGRTWRWPRFVLNPDNAADSTTVPGDTATFVYDAGGNLLRADNRYARIRRQYHVDGSLLVDSLYIRTYRGVDFSQHAYRQVHEYDLEGRRSIHGVGDGLAPGLARDYIRYVYAPGTGDLERVEDLNENEFTFLYDAGGRFRGMQMPGGIVRTDSLDADSRVRRYQVRQTTGGTTTTLFDDVLTRDAAGRVLTAGASHTFAYDAFGAVRESHAMPTDVNEYNQYRLDALGNVYHEFRISDDGSGTMPYQTLLYTDYDGAGRVRGVDEKEKSTLEWRAESRFDYDAAGNREYTAISRAYTGTGAGVFQKTLQEYTLSFYDAENRLWAVDRQRCQTSLDQNQLSKCAAWDETRREEYSAFEEYRYDALGRRVLVVRNQYVIGGFCGFDICNSGVERVVWDGDQILAEIRAWADTTRVWENDDHNGLFFGRVIYTHGPGIDAPLALHRIGLETDATPVTVVPLANWRGIFELARFDDGSTFKEEVYANSLALAGGSVNGYMRPVKNHLSNNWFGSLITNQRDASGTLYRRNRQYDPVTGTFTQEDPIGLAGGLNLYGFGGSDPVNYSDPYGLCPPEDNDNGRWCSSPLRWMLGKFGVEHETADEIAAASYEMAMSAGMAKTGGMSYSYASSQLRARSLARTAPMRTTALANAIPSHARTTLAHIRQAKAAPRNYKGGRVFANDGRANGQVLPRTDASGSAITYQEWDVHPYQRGVNRGAERLVTGSDGKAYYTSDHYTTFTEVK